MFTCEMFAAELVTLAATQSCNRNMRKQIKDKVLPGHSFGDG